MKLTNVRRLTGVNFFSKLPGAAADAAVPDEHKGFAVAIWRRYMRQLLDAIGWTHENIVARSYPGGVSLMTTAPIDALYAATDLIERAWELTCDELRGQSDFNIDTVAEEITDKISAESNSNLMALANAASTRDMTFLGDDGKISLGLGAGCKVWPDNDAPQEDDIDWSEIHDVPVAMVTGTNGKSTTVRLTAAIGAAAGLTVGLSSSDWVRVGKEIIDEGDYSGPAGARLAVRDTRVNLAIIETARGGLMRRGLPLPQTDACLITNIAADHLGDYGITDVAALADAKFLLTHAVKPDGRMVLNGDDPELVSRSVRFGGDITWYGLSLDEQALNCWTDAGGHAVFVKDGVMTLARQREHIPVLPVVDFAPALHGAAKFNISNALGAIALASALDLPVSAMTRALSDFKGTPEENPGRGNFMEIGGVNILIDFAHNPHGLAALVEATNGISAKRRLFLLSQAGDRSDDDIREMTRIVWRVQPDMIIVKELESKLRGRKVGEIPAIFLDELRVLGVSTDRIMQADDEMQSVYQALEWAQPGDFLVLLVYDDRNRVLALLQDLKNKNWQVGERIDR